MKHMLVHCPVAGPVNLTYWPAKLYCPIDFNWCLSSVTDDQKCKATEWLFAEGYIDKLKEKLEPAITPYEECLIEDFLSTI